MENWERENVKGKNREGKRQCKKVIDKWYQECVNGIRNGKMGKGLEKWEWGNLNKDE